MGYDLHITRAAEWSDNQGQEITAQEWQALAREDPELRAMPENGENFFVWKSEADGWLDWFGGNIDAKNPEVGLRRKMHEIAARLGATVRGDDGEEYGADGEPVEEIGTPPAGRGSSIWETIRGWIGGKRNAAGDGGRDAGRDVPDFKVGDRLVDVWGNECTVQAVDAKANGGLGRLEVRYANGTVSTFALVASPMKKAGERI